MGARHGEAPTLESVAARAGVSRATAGRVLAGSPRVSDHARDAVLRAAAELSYVTNRAARSLMTRRSDSIAFVVAEPEERFFADPFFSLVLRGVHAAVAAHDVQLVFAVLTDDAERERFSRFARGGHVDGVAFVSLHGDDPLPRQLQDAGVPVMLQGRPFGTVRDAPARRRVRRRRQPRRRPRGDPPARRGGPHAGSPPSPDRSTWPPPSTVSTATAASSPRSAWRPPASPTPTSPSSAAAGRCATLLDAAPDLDAVVVANDLMALGALQALSERGRRVPDDVALVGFDDIPLAGAAAPPLTTVRQPMAEMGRAIATALLEMVDARSPRPPLVLPTEIVRRASA